MKKQYIYPQNMKTDARLWFWGLKDILTLALALTISVILQVKFGFISPAGITLLYGVLSMRIDETSVLDYIRRAFRYFLTEQQYFEWKENNHEK